MGNCRNFQWPLLRIRRQYGQVLIALLFLIGVAMAALIYTFASPAQTTIQSDKQTVVALALAKDALIGYAAKHATRPGALPCPDIFNTGNDPGLSGNNCQSYIGRLPWKSLGLADIRDGSGERLWYALSPNFRNLNPPTGPVLNSDTPEQLTVMGTSPPTAAIAIIFAPGSAVGSQMRAPANVNSVANYLEGENANGDTIYATAPINDTFNDKLFVITRDNFFPAVTMRVTRAMREVLLAYYTANGYFPNANPFSDSSMNCVDNVLQGRIPLLINNPPRCLTQTNSSWTLPSWFSPNNWNRVVFYAVSSPCAGAVNVLCNLLGNPLDILGSPSRALLISTGRGFSNQTNRPCSASNCTVNDLLEDTENTNGDNVFINPVPSPTNNDRLVIVSP